MAIKFRAGNRMRGSLNDKNAFNLVVVGTIFEDEDTENIYEWNGTVWNFKEGYFASTDSKPSNAKTKSTITESDTENKYRYDGTNWKFTGSGKLTSGTTKPTQAETGSTIFETDTKKTFDYNGSAWVERSSGVGDTVELSEMASGTAGKILGFNSVTGVLEEQDAPVTTIGAVAMSHNTTSGDHTFPTGATGSSNDTYNASYTNIAMGSGSASGSNGGQAYWSSYVKLYDFALPSNVTQIAGSVWANTGGTGKWYHWSQFQFFVKDAGGNTLHSYSTGTVNGDTTLNWSSNCNVSGATEFGFIAKSQGNQAVVNSTNWTGTVLETRNPAVVFDGTTTYWKSLSENNPNVYVDMGSTATATGVMINRDGTDTSETEFKIETSPDASTWTTKRTVTMSNVSAGSDAFVRIPPTSCRYVRIYGTGSNKSLAIRHFKIKTATNDEITASHSHLDISSTDTSIGLDGT